MTDLNGLQWALVGEALKRPERLGELAAALRPEDFTGELQRAMWTAICSLHFEAKPIDVLTVKHCLGGDDGWDAAIAEALGHGCTDALYYAQLLQEGVRLKRLREQGSILSVTETLADAEALVGDLSKILAGKSRSQVTGAEQAAHEFMDRLESKPQYIRTGFAELDEPLFLEAGDFVVIGGYPKAGKSMIAAQIARHLATDYRVGYFFLESNKRKMMDRMICSMSRVPLPKIKNRELGSADWKAINKAAAEFSKLKLEIIDAAGMSVQDIQAISLNRRYEVIFVDYLQLVSSSGENLTVQIGNVSKGLHVFGQKHGVSVFALAQLSRPEKTGGKPKPPNLSSFRESGQIEQDADAAMLLYPSDPNDNRSSRILNLAKNKEGEAVYLELSFDGALQTFTPLNKQLSRAQSFKEGERRMKELQEKQRQITFEENPGGREGLPF